MNFITRFQSLNREQRALVLVSASLFLPMELTSLVLVLYVLYALFKRDLGSMIRLQPGAFFLYTFVGLELVVSLFYKNYIGAVNALGIGLVALYIAQYRQLVTKDVFLFCLDLMLILSLFSAVFGLIEFNAYSNMAGYSFFDFHVQNKPSRRVHVFFMNANLYAMMIEFFIVSCLYRWVQVSSLSQKTYYVFVGLINLLMLYLTGCRTAFAPLGIVIPLFFILYGNKKYILIASSLFILAISLVFLMPNLIPRLSDLSTLNSRFKIWNGAMQAFMMYPFFGNGPQTYGHLYSIYHWHKAPHAHNIYIDSLASYGLVGTGLVLGYGWFVCRDIWCMRHQKDLFALMISFVVIFLVHGFFDCTLNVLCCSLFFFMVLNAGKTVES